MTSLTVKSKPVLMPKMSWKMSMRGITSGKLSWRGLFQISPTLIKMKDMPIAEMSGASRGAFLRRL